MYQVSGKVIKGEGYGRQLGFPTANLDRRDYARRRLNIGLGVYVGYAEISNFKFQISNEFLNRNSKIKKFKAGIVIGPIDKSGQPKIEAHLIGFEGNLYGKKITISLQKYLRPFRKFESEAELKKQIKKDIKIIEQNLKN